AVPVTGVQTCALPISGGRHHFRVVGVVALLAGRQAHLVGGVAHQAVVQPVVGRSLDLESVRQLQVALALGIDAEGAGVGRGHVDIGRASGREGSTTCV